jgi:hypothetical protein
MALNAYTVYSAPLIQRKRSKDALDVLIITNPDKPWLPQPEIAPHQAKTRFVPAQGEYDDHGILLSSAETLRAPSVKETMPREVGSWYTSLPRLHTDAHGASVTSKNTPRLVSAAPSPSNSRASSAPASPDTVIPSKRRHGADWFKSTVKTPNPESTATSTLADMLRRDPPNVSNPHTPPVYYGIGPKNKGYEMLSKSGWEEGQPLGPRVGLGSAVSSRRVQSPKQGVSHTPQPTESKEKKEKWMVLDRAMPKLVVTCGEGTPGDVEVIDLTVPNEEQSEDSSEGEKGEDTEMFCKPNSEEQEDESSSGTEWEEGDYEDVAPSAKPSKAILTPIPVALKHDRKGLGLSKSKKLVTHSSLALRHHIQNGALDRRQHISEIRRVERAHLQGAFGQGKNAFARKAKEDQRKRDRLMEYMGS